MRWISQVNMLKEINTERRRKVENDLKLKLFGVFFVMMRGQRRHRTTYECN